MLTEKLLIPSEGTPHSRGKHIRKASVNSRMDLFKKCSF